jgi:hypothetical protein
MEQSQQQVLCPKCGSNQITANKKGFSAGRAIAGDILLGPVGLLAGAAGRNKIIITCLNCGCQFKPGDRPDMKKIEARKAFLESGKGHELLLKNRTRAKRILWFICFVFLFFSIIDLAAKNIGSAAIFFFIALIFMVSANKKNR